MTRQRFQGWQSAPSNSVQGDSKVRLANGQFARFGGRPIINESILRLAEAEYERQYGTSQTINRLRERGGLSLGEVICLLAETVVRYAPEDQLVPKSLTIKEAE